MQFCCSRDDGVLAQCCRIASLVVLVAAAAAVWTSRVGMVLPNRGVAISSGRAGTPLPSYQECVSPLARSLQYCNISLSIEERVSSLISDMTLKEKVDQLSPFMWNGNQCGDITRGVPRLGLGRYMWLVETNSRVSSACLQVEVEEDAEGGGGDNSNGGGSRTELRCSTAFPGTLGLAATFNATLWSLKGDVISTELRALNNAGGRRLIKWSNPKVAPLIGVTGFGPNINVARDPRFGRTSELPGEDPYLNGRYATEVLKAMQREDGRGYMKMLAFVKHFTAYSRETDRGQDSYSISMHDLFDTYLPQYETALTEGRAAGVMCSYNAINGVPSCANGFLLDVVLRGMWNRPDAIVFSDCVAIPNIQNFPAKAPDAKSAAAWAIGNGTDVEAGSHFFRKALPGLVKEGALREEVVDAALKRVLTAHMRTGRFDDPTRVSWTSIKPSVIGSDRHLKVRDDAARQSAVLLRNDGNVLPLSPGRNILIVGPASDDGYMMIPSYQGEDSCPGQGMLGKEDCAPTFLEGFKRHNGVNGTINYIKGVDEISFKRAGWREVALEAVRFQDINLVVLALGISTRTEAEENDRVETTLPGLQESFARDVLKITAARGIPALLILTNGGALSLDGLLPPRNYYSVYNAASSAADGDGDVELPECYRSRSILSPEQQEDQVLPAKYAVVEAYNPAFGAHAVVAALYGDGPAQWARTVVTSYPASWADAHRMDQYDMAADDGRTYRYHKAEDDDKVVLVTFGEGMPAERPADLRLNCTMSPTLMASSLENRGGWKVTCDATNTGARPASALAMVYVRPSDRVRERVGERFPVPQRSLRGFGRVMVKPDGTERIAPITLSTQDLLLVNEQGTKEVVTGLYHVDIWDGWDAFASFSVSLEE